MWISVPKFLIHGVALAKSDPTPSFSQMFPHLLENALLRWKTASKAKHQHCSDSAAI